MTKKEMFKFIREDNPITYNSVEIIFLDGQIDYGFFTSENEEFNNVNKWRFVPNKSSLMFGETKSKEFTRIIDGFKVKELKLL